ncbi:MAG: PepSY-associated TM helix domain-containing protein [Verrucomicrobia bacterium]|nr:PepSY-associated TM helix domain-containing protein [Verrucomicrobiota bacterium]
METNPWARCDRWMRALHLYTSMVLVPWMTVYAVSAFCLNHGEWFTQGLHLEQKWETVRELDFTPGPEFSRTPEAQAAAILRHVDLEGPHRIQGIPSGTEMVVFRYCATGHYRVSWFPPRSRVVVERYLPRSFYSVVNNLHFQHGYRPAFAHWAWAAVVDFSAISTLIWVISGIYLWARRPRQRLLGGLCLIAGILLFAALTLLLCR